MNQESANPYGMLRVLVVDDHMLMRNMICQLLQSLGIQEIDTATDGEEGLKKAKDAAADKYPYNIAFFDWHMPGMDGLAALKACRENDKLKDMAIVMLTAEQEEKNIVKAVESGATSYVVKPVSRNALEKNLEKVMHWLEQRGALIGAKKPANAKKSNYQESQKQSVSRQLSQDLKPIVARGIENIFSELFMVQIVSDALIKDGSNKDMICIGRLHQKDITIALRFFFDQQLLKPLLRQLYAPDFLNDQKVYEDAACEIVNILCSQVKAFLNKHGYELELDFPEMGDRAKEAADANSIINVQFSLNEDQYFMVDVTAKDATD